MEKTKYILALISVIVALSGCATTLSPQASMVKISTKDSVEGYKFLGNLTASSPLTGVMSKTGYQNAINSVLEQAAKRGATDIVIDPSSDSYYWATSEHVRAEAYKAPSN